MLAKIQVIDIICTNKLKDISNIFRPQNNAYKINREYNNIASIN